MSAPRAPRTLAVLAVGLLATGCAGGDGEVTGPDEGTEDPTATPTTPTTPTTPSPAAAAVPTDVLDQAVAAAADHSGVAAEQVEVVRAEDVRWPSSALGCPEEGQMYSQAITDGYWIVLQASGEQLDYRAADGGPVRLCEDGDEPLRGGDEG